MLMSTVCASAQTVFSLSADSDYRYRGVSLSRGRPDLRLSLDYDHADGCYAGAAVTAVELDDRRRQAQWLAYGGCAGSATGDLTADAGLSLARFGRDAAYDYGEVYAGVSASRWNLRTHLSPSYFGSGQRTAYLEINIGLPLTLPWRLFGHLGVLRKIGHATAEVERESVDMRFGMATAFRDWQWQLARVSGRPQGIYPVPYEFARQAWVLSSTLPF